MPMVRGVGDAGSREETGHEVEDLTEVRPQPTVLLCVHEISHCVPGRIDDQHGGRDTGRVFSDGERESDPGRGKSESDKIVALEPSRRILYCAAVDGLNFHIDTLD